jgi:hypothetical protein
LETRGRAAKIVGWLIAEFARAEGIAVKLTDKTTERARKRETTHFIKVT